MTTISAVRKSPRGNLAALASAQKPAYRTAAYSRLVNRPAGRLVAAYMHAIGTTPNQATVASATLSAAGLAVMCLVAPKWWTGLVVAGLLAAGYVMDSVDGQLARLRGGGSRSGEWLDHTVDCFKTGFLHLAVLISWYRFSGLERGWLLAPLAYEVVAVVTYFGLILVPTLRPPAPRPAPATALHEHPLRKYALLPTDYGFLCWIFVLLPWSDAFHLVYVALLLANAAALAVALRKWWAELRALDMPTNALAER